MTTRAAVRRNPDFRHTLNPYLIQYLVDYLRRGFIRLGQIDNQFHKIY